MTTEQLHEILDDPNRKLTKDELSEVIYQLKEDVFNEYYKACIEDPNHFKCYFYMGEQNAFYIVLDLLEHLESEPSND